MGHSAHRQCPEFRRAGAHPSVRTYQLTLGAQASQTEGRWGLTGVLSMYL